MDVNSLPGGDWNQIPSLFVPKQIKERLSSFSILVRRLFPEVTAFAERERISGASLTALGAFEHATVGSFDLESKQYQPILVNEQAEVLGIFGDIAIGDNGTPTVHIHTVLGLKDGTTRGGHRRALWHQDPKWPIWTTAMI